MPANMIVDASVSWISPNEGGRNAPVPVGVKYGPIIIFEGQDANEGYWSAEIYVIEHINCALSNIKLTFLVRDAPYSYLATGQKFTLYEGQKKVATGIVK